MSNHDEEEAIKAAEEASRLAAHKPANWKDKLPSFSSMYLKIVTETDAKTVPIT
jgi:hypothetical protein